jgi:hypothetical protein
MFNARETATVLAALRFWQREGAASGGHEVEIATDGGRFAPLSNDEIDALCEGTNCKTVSVSSMDAICQRLLDSEEHAVEAAIPPVAEDAVEAIRALAAECARMEAEKLDLVSQRDEIGARTCRIVIDLDGGLIQNVTGDMPLEYMVYDHDIEGCDDDQVATRPSVSEEYEMMVEVFKSGWYAGTLNELKVAEAFAIVESEQ